MSSTGTLDRESSEILRRERKAMEEREKALIRRHEAQMDNLRIKTDQRVRLAEERQAFQIQDIRNKNRAYHSDANKRHHKQIEALQDRYNDVSRQKFYENKHEKERISEEVRRREENQDRNNQGRFDYLNEKYGRNMKEFRGSYEKALAEKGSGHQESLINQKREIVKAKDKEQELVRNSHRNSRENLQNNFRRYRQFSEDESKYRTDKHERELERNSEKKKRYIDDLKARGRDEQEFMRKSYQDHIMYNKEEYNESLAKERDRMYKGLRERTEDETKYLQWKVEDLERQNARDKIKNKRETDRQLFNLKKRNQKIAQTYAENQRRFLKDVNDERFGERRELHEHFGGKMTMAERNYKERLQLTEKILRSNLIEEKGRLEQEKNQEKLRADLRVQMAHQGRDRDLRRMAKRQNEVLQYQKDQAKLEHEKVVEDMKIKHRFEVNKLRDMLTASSASKQMTAFEIQSDYQDRLDDLANQKDREKRIMIDLHARELRNRGRAESFKEKAIKEQYEHKFSQIKNNYEKQLNAMHDIHAEQMDKSYNHMRKRDESFKKYE